MIVAIFLQSRSSANIRQIQSERENFWFEMGFAQWSMIRILSEFYDSPLLLPDTLASLYMDEEFLKQYISKNLADIQEPTGNLSRFRKFQKKCAVAPYLHMNAEEMESEIEREEKENDTMLGAIRLEILQRPIFLDPEPKPESGKYIKMAFPECRMEFKGFGRFFGYSDLNQVVFWTPWVMLRYFYMKYSRAGEEIIEILKKISWNAGMYHAKREITMENQRELASAGVQAVMKNYVSS